VVSYDDGLPNSGEIFRDSVKNRESLREIEGYYMEQGFTAELCELLEVEGNADDVATAAATAGMRRR
jgi:hypothetical protein